GGGDALFVRAPVAEAERIAGGQVGVPHVERAVVEEEPPPALGLELVVMAAESADLEGGRELARGQRLAAAVAATEHAGAERALLAGVGGGEVLFRPRHGYAAAKLISMTSEGTRSRGSVFSWISRA